MKKGFIIIISLMLSFFSFGLTEKKIVRKINDKPKSIKKIVK